MMFDVQEHVERESILDTVMQSSSKVMRPVAMMVDSPNREECGHALTNQHCPHAVPQHAAVQDPEDRQNPRPTQKQFGQHDPAQPSIAMPEGSDMQKDRKQRPEDESAPCRHLGAATFYIAWT
jgi:hypothetical protein